MDEKVRAALALDLIEKIDLAVTTTCETVEEVHWMLVGMAQAAKDHL